MSAAAAAAATAAADHDDMEDYHLKNNDDWEALFALANGGGGGGGDIAAEYRRDTSSSSPSSKQKPRSPTSKSSSSSAATTSTTSSCRSPQKRRRPYDNDNNNNNATRSNYGKSSFSVDDDSKFEFDFETSFQAYLKRRSASDVSWPSWMKVGEGFHPGPDECPQWIGPIGVTTISMSMSTNHYGILRTRPRCQRCNRSLAHHFVSLQQPRAQNRSQSNRKKIMMNESNDHDHDDDDIQSLMNDVLCATRNVRCAALHVVLRQNNCVCDHDHDKGNKEGVVMDIPLLSPSTIRRFCDDWEQSTARLLQPLLWHPARQSRSCIMIPETLRNAIRKVNLHLLFKLIYASSTMQAAVDEDETTVSQSLNNETTTMMMTKTTTTTTTFPLRFMEPAVELIVSLDRVYYQLYYFQITQPIQPSPKAKLLRGGDYHHDHDPTMFIPHPLSYFGLLASDLDEGAETLLQQFVSRTTTTTTTTSSLLDHHHHYYHHERMGDRWGLEMGEGEEGRDEKEEMQPTLACLHHIRLLETVQMFRIWMTTAEARIQTIQALTVRSPVNHRNHYYECHHETPAPAALVSWRDSGRDFLCHLYSYATLSRATIAHLVQAIVQSSSTRKNNVNVNVNAVVEIGAGTGYMAHVLQEHVRSNKKKEEGEEEEDGGWLIEAWDLRPPPRLGASTRNRTYSHCEEETKRRRSTHRNHNKQRPTPTMNEYHGETPSFTSVHAGSDQSIASTYYDDVSSPSKSSSKSSTRITRNRNWSRTALLLCYPPPEPASFALRALQRFTEHGGQWFLYVGEFKGLTGNRAFEFFLQQHYECTSRFPTLCWTTDASFVTIWQKRRQLQKKKKKKDTATTTTMNPSLLLLPCSVCRQCESRKQCRLLRALTYCSPACCQADKVRRAAWLRLAMIHVDTDDDDVVDAVDLPHRRLRSLRLDYNNPNHFSELR